MDRCMIYYWFIYLGFTVSIYSEAVVQMEFWCSFTPHMWFLRYIVHLAFVSWWHIITNIHWHIFGSTLVYLHPLVISLVHMCGWGGMSYIFRYSIRWCVHTWEVYGSIGTSHLSLIACFGLFLWLLSHGGFIWSSFSLCANLRRPLLLIFSFSKGNLAGSPLYLNGWWFNCQPQ